MSSNGSRAALRRAFPAPAPEDWRAEAERLLRGASFEKKMYTRTPEGLRLDPLYDRTMMADVPHLDSQPGEAPYLRGSSTSRDPAWLVAQEQSLSNPPRDNARLLQELQAGLDAVLLCPTQSLSPGELQRVLQGVALQHIPVFVHAGARADHLRPELEALCKSQGIELASLQGALAADPLGTCALRGSTDDLPTSLDALVETSKWSAENAGYVRSLWIRGENWHEAGAHAIQELGITMAILVETLREADVRGLEASRLAPRLMISLGVSGHTFTEISKLRALRLLVDRVLQSCGVEARERRFFLHARCASRNKSLIDEHVNLLRSTTEAFAAAVGGADSMHVEAFDEPSGRGGEFSRRLARNQQIILRDEAQLGRVIDPAGGAWYVERLTADLAAASWSLLQEIETEGGFLAALRAGSLQARLAETRHATIEGLATRREVRVGTNQYPGSLARRDEETSAPTGAEDSLSTVPADPSRDFDVLPSFRECRPFEALRSAVEEARDEGSRLKVFVVTLGAIARYMPRLDFTSAAFEVGGFAVARGTGYTELSQASEMARRSGAGVLAICGLDESYHTEGVAMARALQESCPDASLVLAGLPDDDLRGELEAAGVEFYLHLRSDLLALLTELALREGVTP